MAERVNLPTQLEIPPEFQKDRNTLRYFEERDFVLFQLWKKTGGSQSLPVASAEVTASQQANINVINERLGSGNPLTSDETGFTVDSIKLTVDMTEA